MGEPSFSCVGLISLELNKSGKSLRYKLNNVGLGVVTLFHSHVDLNGFCHFDTYF